MTKAEKMEERAKDAVSRLLTRQLILPKIYFEPKWPNNAPQVDVLAIDRSGTGDVHAVEIKRFAKDAPRAIAQVSTYPAHFRWIAVFGDPSDPALQAKFVKLLDNPSGRGRIGVIQVIRSEDDRLQANIVVRPERFPTDVSLRKDFADFLQSTVPDITHSDYDRDADSKNPILAEGEIADRLDQVEQLLGEGFTEAAFLLAWRSIEAAMRLLIKKEGLGSDDEPMPSLIRLLFAFNLITQADESLLRSSLTVRNVIVHGYRTPIGAEHPVIPLVLLGRRLLEAKKVHPQP
jgi:hypothetical protein